MLLHTCQGAQFTPPTALTNFLKQEGSKWERKQAREREARLKNWPWRERRPLGSKRGPGIQEKWKMEVEEESEDRSSISSSSGEADRLTQEAAILSSFIPDNRSGKGQHSHHTNGKSKAKQSKTRRDRRQKGSVPELGSQGRMYSCSLLASLPCTEPNLFDFGVCWKGALCWMAFTAHPGWGYL